VEFFRQPDPHLGFIVGPLSMGQLLTIPMMLIGVAMIGYLIVKKEEPPAQKKRIKKGRGGKTKK
jgi:phosphatidylglycerol:prolipoprotein diacylglycerol transferase